MYIGAHCQTLISFPSGPYYLGQHINYMVESTAGYYSDAYLMTDDLVMWVNDSTPDSTPVPLKVVNSSGRKNTFMIPTTITPNTLSPLLQVESFQFSYRNYQDDAGVTSPRLDEVGSELEQVPYMIQTKTSKFKVFNPCDYMTFTKHLYQCIEANMPTMSDPTSKCFPKGYDENLIPAPLDAPKQYCSCAPSTERSLILGPDCRIKVEIVDRLDSGNYNNILFYEQNNQLQFTITDSISQHPTSHFNFDPGWLLSFDIPGSSVDPIELAYKPKAFTQIINPPTPISGNPNPVSITLTIKNAYIPISMYSQTVSFPTQAKVSSLTSLTNNILQCRSTQDPTLPNLLQVQYPTDSSEPWLFCDCASPFSFGLECEMSIALSKAPSQTTGKLITSNFNQNFNIYGGLELTVQLSSLYPGYSFGTITIKLRLYESNPNPSSDITLTTVWVDASTRTIPIPADQFLTSQLGKQYYLIFIINTNAYTNSGLTKEYPHILPGNGSNTFHLKKLLFTVINPPTSTSTLDPPPIACELSKLSLCNEVGTSNLEPNSCSPYSPFGFTLKSQKTCQCKPDYYGDYCDLEIKLNANSGTNFEQTTPPSPIAARVEFSMYSFGSGMTQILQHELTSWNLHDLRDYYNPAKIFPVTVGPEFNIFVATFTIQNPSEYIIVLTNPILFENPIGLTGTVITVQEDGCAVLDQSGQGCNRKYRDHGTLKCFPEKGVHERCQCTSNTSGAIVLGNRCEFELTDLTDDIIPFDTISLEYTPGYVTPTSGDRAQYYLHIYTYADQIADYKQTITLQSMDASNIIIPNLLLVQYPDISFKDSHQFFFYLSTAPQPTEIRPSYEDLLPVFKTPAFIINSLPLLTPSQEYIPSLQLDHAIITNISWEPPLRPEGAFPLVNQEPMSLRFLLFFDQDPSKLPNLDTISESDLGLVWTSADAILEATISDDSTQGKMIWVPESLMGYPITLHFPPYISIPTGSTVVILAQSSIYFPYWNPKLLHMSFTFSGTELLLNQCEREYPITTCNPYSTKLGFCDFSDQISLPNFLCASPNLLPLAPLSPASSKCLLLQCPAPLQPSADCTECICLTKSCQTFTRTFMLYFNIPSTATTFQSLLTTTIQDGLYTMLDRQLTSLLQLITADYGSILWDLEVEDTLPYDFKYKAFTESIHTRLISSLNNNDFIPVSTTQQVKGVVCTLVFNPLNSTTSSGDFIDFETPVLEQLEQRLTKIQSILSQYFTINDNGSNQNINPLYNRFFGNKYFDYNKLRPTLLSSQYLPKLIQLSTSAPTSYSSPRLNTLQPLCQTQQQPFQLGPCPRITSLTTSRFWSKCDSTLKVLCPDYNGVAILPPSTISYQWCSQQNYPLYPLQTKVECTSLTPQMLSAPVLSNLVIGTKSTPLSPSNPIRAGKYIPIAWDYTGPQNYTLTIYLKTDTNYNQYLTTVPAYPQRTLLFIPFSIPTTLSVYIFAEITQNISHFSRSVLFATQGFEQCAATKWDKYTGYCQCTGLNSFKSDTVNFEETQCLTQTQCLTAADRGQCVNSSYPRFTTGTGQCNDQDCICPEDTFFSGKQCQLCDLEQRCDQTGTLSYLATECNRCTCKKGYGGKFCQFRSIIASLTYTKVEQTTMPSSNIQQHSYVHDYRFDSSSESIDVDNNNDELDILDSTHQFIHSLSPSTNLLLESATIEFESIPNHSRQHQLSNLTKTIQLTPESTVPLPFQSQLFALLSLPEGPSTLSPKSTDLLTSQLSISLGLEQSSIEILRTNTTIIYTPIPTPAKNIQPNNQLEQLQLEQLQAKPTTPIPATKTTTTTVSFSVISTTPSIATTSNSLPAGSTSIEDLYSTWNQLKKDLNSTQIGQTPLEETDDSTTSGALDPFDPNCDNSTSPPSEDDDESKCPIGTDPLVDPEVEIVPDPPTKKSSATTIIAVVIGVCVPILLIIVIAILCWYASKNKVWCCAEHNRKNAGSSRTRGKSDVEMSIATNLSHGNSNHSGETDVQSKTGLSETKSKTADLIPVELDDEEESLPQNWGKFQHKDTQDIIYVNSVTMISQRHRPGTEAKNKGKWF
jgi:hypothetical protein